jgi:hypothetical protein
MSEQLPFDNIGRPTLRLYTGNATILINNLIATPSIQTNYFGAFDLQVMLATIDAPTIAAYTTVRDLAAGIGIATYPGFRTHASGPFSDYVDRTYWQARAADVLAVAALRPARERRIGLDMENYGTGNAEPSAAALATAGYTVQQLRDAMDPFVVALNNVDALPCAYPAGVSGGEDLLYVAAFRGWDNIELWTELTFEIAEAYRQGPNYAYVRSLASLTVSQSAIEQLFPGAVIRAVVGDDIFRRWGQVLRTNQDALGGVRPWVFDVTRADQANWGTQGWVDGTNLKSVNDVQYLWPIQIPETHVNSPFCVGLGSPALALDQVAGNAGSLVVQPTQKPDLEGMRFLTPASPNTWAGLRAFGAMPASASLPWTIDLQFRIPSSLATSKPIVCNGQYNVGIWQVYYDNSANKLILQVRAGTTTYTMDVLVSPARDTDLRIQIGRNGNEWLHNVGRTNIGASASFTSVLLFAAGQDPATFPTNNTTTMMNGALLTGQIAIWHRYLSDPDLVLVRAGSYPWGRET